MLWEVQPKIAKKHKAKVIIVVLIILGRPFFDSSRGASIPKHHWRVKGYNNWYKYVHSRKSIKN
jgi:hypothetical protein